MKLVRPDTAPQKTPQGREGGAPSARRLRQGTTASMTNSMVMMPTISSTSASVMTLHSAQPTSVPMRPPTSMMRMLRASNSRWKASSPMTSMRQSSGSSMPAASRAGISRERSGTPIMPRLPRKPDLLNATIAIVATATDQNQGSNMETRRRWESARAYERRAESIVKAPASAKRQPPQGGWRCASPARQLFRGLVADARRLLPLAIGLHHLIEHLGRLAHEADIGVAIVPERIGVAEQFQVMLLEGGGDAARLVGRRAERDEGLLAEREGGAEGFALEHLDAERHQLVGMAAIDGARGDAGLGEVAADQLGNGDDAVATGHGDNNEACIGGAGGTQDIEPAAIAVEHLYTEALDQLDLRGIVVDQGHRVALGTQQAGDDLAEAAVAQHDHRTIVRQVGGNVGLRPPGIDARHPDPVEEQQQDRRQRHRQRHDHRPELGVPGRQESGRLREVQHHEGELARLAEQQGEQQPIGDVHPEEAAEHIE